MTRINQPFSNGTEEEAWAATWCDRCLHDHAHHQMQRSNYMGAGEPCALAARGFLGHSTTPMVWQPFAQRWHFSLPAKFECRAYEPCEDCGLSVHLRPGLYE